MEVTDFARFTHSQLSPIHAIRTPIAHRGSIAGLSKISTKDGWETPKSPDTRPSRPSNFHRRRISRMSFRSGRSPSCFDATPSVFFYPAYVDQFSLPNSPLSNVGWVSDISANLLSPQHKRSVKLNESGAETYTVAAPVRKVTVHDPRDDIPADRSVHSSQAVRWSTVESEDMWQADEKDEFDGVSTLMLRGVPNRLTREMLWEELRSRGFQNDIDFFNLPGDMSHQRNVGYCFVNMTTPEAANRFREVFEGATLGFGKICHVGIGRVQGLQDNLEACRATMDAKQLNFHPLTVENGAPSVVCALTPNETERKVGKSGKSIEGNTSLMLRNIPNSYTRGMLLEVLESRGLMEDINFFYVPIDLRYRRNVGYCFLNVVNEDAAVRFRNAIEGTRVENSGSSKLFEVGLAQVQGLHANIEAYRNSAVMYMPEKFHPMLFKDGVQIPFPSPNLSRKELRTIKTKKKGVSMRNWAESDKQDYLSQPTQEQFPADAGVISLHDHLESFF